LSCCEGNSGWYHFILVLIFPMALNASKVSSSPFVTQRKLTSTSYGIICSFSKSFQKNKLHPTHQGIELQQLSSKHLLTAKLAFSGESLQGIHGKPVSLIISRRSSTLCQSTRTHRTEEKECTRPYSDSSDSSRSDYIITCVSPLEIYQTCHRHPYFYHWTLSFCHYHFG
jgi:hypothetical protein